MEANPYVRLVRVILQKNIEINENGLVETISHLIATLKPTTITTCKNGTIIIHGREQEVLRMRFGLEGKSPHTLRAIAEHFSISHERVRQIECRSLRKMRHPSRAKHLLPFIKNNDDRTELILAVSEWDARCQAKEVVSLGVVHYFTSELDKPLKDLELSARSSNWLAIAGIKTLSQLVVKTEKEILALKNIHRKSVNELREVLETRGLSFGMTIKESE